ncbi:MAG: hypothetical protein A2138_01915 [Deltaproteobacteria bacterium RBG_16_71_12]|nr:MAG: hypothetical protein A2138_01915 [Deltaproteobacteria bacterium RBG_16_71_12]
MTCIASVVASSCAPNADPPPDAGVDPVDCGDPPTGAGTEHGSSIEDESWTADGSPHVLPFDTSIYGTLTLESCALVQIAGARAIDVRGALIGRPGVRIESADASPFATIRLVGGTLDLEGVVIENGGDPRNTIPYLAGALDLSSPAGPATDAVARLRDVSVRGSASNGIVVHDGGGFSDDSANLIITGSAAFPISIWSRAAGTLPTGDYSGNATDEILLPATAVNEGIAEDTTFHARGVPYRVGHDTSSGDLRVQAVTGELATLTIEPGVTLRFKAGAVMHVEQASGADPARGALIANGTANAPIVFTSAAADPQPGDWLGVWFGLVPSASNALSNARVEYAGGASATGSDSCLLPPAVINDAAIRVRGPVGTSFVTDTVIVDSASNGIDRGFRSDSKPSFLGTNTFTNVAGCTETWPRDDDGACPDPVPCPAG